MPHPFAPPIVLDVEARTRLEALVRAHSTPQALVFRSRLVLRVATAEQPSNLQVANEFGCSRNTVVCDEFELCDGNPLGYRLLKRAGNVAVHVFLPRSEARSVFLITELVTANDGHMDGHGGTSKNLAMVFTFPIRVGLPRIEKLMAEIQNEVEGFEWCYGNIYDANDGETPLNWWLNGEEFEP